MSSHLSIREFIEQENINIDTLYVDKFWSSVAEDKWLYINNDMLKWIGYESIRDRRVKEYYIQLLKSNFIENEDYKQLNSSEMQEVHVRVHTDIQLPTQISSGNRTKHLIVSPDCFKEALMLMNTGRAKQIRKYYVSIEKVFRRYMKYCDDCSKAQLQQTQNELEEAKKSSDAFKMMIVNKSLIKREQYVYVASTRNYAKQNIFKVGATKQLEKRMSGYQTGRTSEDKYSYLYIVRCVNAKALEHLIFARLKPFRYEDNQELFQIHFDTLKSIISLFELFENESIVKINTILEEYYSVYSDLPIPKIDDLIIPDINEYIEENFNITPIDRYTPVADLKPNPLSLTTEQINERLQPQGLRLVGEYSGKCDDNHMFECLSPLKHQFESTYDYIRNLHCSLCGHHRILDGVPIYAYRERTYDYTQTYASFDTLKNEKPELDHQLLRNIIREERWLTVHQGFVYSILSPYENKLDLYKPLTEAEQFIINVLGIHYETMRNRIMGSNAYIVAVDEKNKRAYFGISATEMSKFLNQVGSSKAINRKTIPKYLGRDAGYGGYKWLKLMRPMYTDFQMIDVKTLK